MKTTVSEKGQITIPKPLRVRLGFDAGQRLEVSEERGRLLLSKKPADDPVSQVYGILKLGRSTDRLLRALRGRKPR